MSNESIWAAEPNEVRKPRQGMESRMAQEPENRQVQQTGGKPKRGKPWTTHTNEDPSIREHYPNVRSVIRDEEGKDILYVI